MEDFDVVLAQCHSQYTWIKGPNQKYRYRIYNFTTRQNNAWHMNGYLQTNFPAQPKVTTGQKTRHSMTCNMVDPSLISQLFHYGINPRIPSLSLTVKEKGNTKSAYEYIFCILYDYQSVYTKSCNLFSSENVIPLKNIFLL